MASPRAVPLPPAWENRSSNCRACGQFLGICDKKGCVIGWRTHNVVMRTITVKGQETLVLSCDLLKFKEVRTTKKRVQEAAVR